MRLELDRAEIVHLITSLKSSTKVLMAFQDHPEIAASMSDREKAEAEEYGLECQDLIEKLEAVLK